MGAPSPEPARGSGTARKVTLALVALAAVGALAWTATLGVLDGGGAEPEADQWQDGQTRGPWMLMYHGFGPARLEGEDVVLEPRTAQEEEKTHGALAHTVGRCSDVEFEVSLRTEAQLRQGEPNPWEVGWVLWALNSDREFYAIALKPNGWELTKQDADYQGDQRFLATGHERTFPVGQDYRVRVVQDGARSTVWVDGEELVSFTDEQTPYLEGSVGLYTEDARVRFMDAELPECLTRDSSSAPTAATAPSHTPLQPQAGATPAREES